MDCKQLMLEASERRAIGITLVSQFVFGGKRVKSSNTFWQRSNFEDKNALNVRN